MFVYLVLVEPEVLEPYAVKYIREIGEVFKCFLVFRENNLVI